ncbi:hypothetical protein QQ008_08450 [Fulvivirgaceae bacterium BMA10]|uniref:Uncharacterized protein n=1 Tax=Splendidivirga corallicola TaxID=3051826 RepID=A0ABT8KMD3_9BACT|nr:hypothetical protein [Fulvivirgaceae bacterium BMA10]
MNFTEFMEGFANEIGGQYSEYDNTKSVIIVPIDEFRFQTVVGYMRHIEYYNKTAIEYSSKVCPYSEDLDLKRLLEENTKFCHAKFSIVDDFVKVEASAFLDNSTDDLLKEIILEVAKMADTWEYKLTGMDVH